MRVANPIVAFDGGDELVDERVKHVSSWSVGSNFTPAGSPGKSCMEEDAWIQSISGRVLVSLSKRGFIRKA
ncbi:hypothetical protein C4D60_Mb06t27850 [Musa balbisiana]|uniref:Uncharacterized protein n=1 Tax=Musa balbisiana TaxID=52838 RepID=A0A4S8IR51_MUSBA|nr:hypothetical protein C4D60_Mb06t27850 [Musa balbisiana]